MIKWVWQFIEMSNVTMNKRKIWLFNGAWTVLPIWPVLHQQQNVHFLLELCDQLSGQRRKGRYLFKHLNAYSSTMYTSWLTCTKPQKTVLMPSIRRDCPEDPVEFRIQRQFLKIIKKGVMSHNYKGTLGDSLVDSMTSWKFWSNPEYEEFH